MFENDLRHGEGKYIWPDGRMYEGGFVSDKRHGEGKQIYATGGKYFYQGECVYNSSVCSKVYNSGVCSKIYNSSKCSKVYLCVV